MKQENQELKDKIENDNNDTRILAERQVMDKVYLLK